MQLCAPVRDQSQTALTMFEVHTGGVQPVAEQNSHVSGTLVLLVHNQAATLVCESPELLRQLTVLLFVRTCALCCTLPCTAAVQLLLSTTETTHTSTP